MSNLVPSELAAVSTGSHLYLYFQEGAELRETQSSDGKAWSASSSAVAGDLDPNGSAITAYYVKNDGSQGGKSTIHVIWIGHDRKLHEKVKIEGDSSWKVVDFPSEFKPTESSRLGSGVCHDNKSDLSHQWVHFVEENKDGNFEVAELRRGSQSKWIFVYRKVLEEEPAKALPGTSIAENLTDPITHLFIQDHDLNILEYEGGYEEWKAKEVRVEGKQVSASTPLAACASGKDDKPYLFYVSPHSGSQAMAIQHWQVGQGSKKVDDYTPASRLGATSMGGKAYLFFRKPTTPLTITVKEYSGGAWSAGTKVI